MAINKTTVDKIASQAIQEIALARTYKQSKISGWQTNEQMYYSKKTASKTSRSNVNLGRMQEFVHTLLSKIDNPLIFKFIKRKPAQIKRVDRLNALRKFDQQRDNWDIKDLVGKKQAIIYGRAVYSYYADSINGYKPHLEPIDVYDFLIDPSCGGLDIEEARHLGSYSVTLDRRQLKEGVKNKIYIAKTVKDLLSGSGNAGESSQEKTNKSSRVNDTGVLSNKSDNDPTKYKFWRWFTTYQEDGERYYLLMDNGGNCIRCEKITELVGATKDYPLGAWPFWTWAAFPDLTEFWTPSYADYAREIFMAQDVTINQMLDNAEAINKPQRVVNTSVIKNMADIKYRRDGVIKVKGDVDVNKAYQTVNVPSISTPLQVYEVLEGIVQKTTGVTDGSSGVADEAGKVGIYEGNQAAAADRYNLLNKSYAFGYDRFAKLWQTGVRKYLTKKVAIDIIGPSGVEVEEVKQNDIFRKKEDFNVLIESSNTDDATSIQDKRTKLAFLQRQMNNPIANQEKVFEMEASIAGLNEAEVEQLLDTSSYGNSELMGECERDIEKLLDGEEIRPNQMANNAYKQKMVNYLRDHEEDITFEQFQRLSLYIGALEQVIMKNEARNMQNELIEERKNAINQLNPTQVNQPNIQESPENYEIQNN